jgi:hypothetical protein
MRPRSPTRIPRLVRSLAALVAAVGAIACGSVRAFRPGDELLGSEGLLVFQVRSESQLESIRIGGAYGRIPLARRAGTELHVVALAAGSYRWSELVLTDYVPPYGFLTFRFSDDANLEFHVERGRINYVGMIDVYRGDVFHVGIRAIDRTAIALGDLRTQFPDLVDRYPIVYSGPARNVFLEHYLAAKRSAEAEPPR